MTQDELIAKQQFEIENLKQQIEDHETACERVFSILYSIGGPLNDNYLQYSKGQLMPFFKISQALELM